MAPFVATVHDVSSAPGLARRRHAYKRLVWPWAARRARALVAVSRFAGEETARHFGVPMDRIEVIHSGPGLTDVPPAERDGAAAPERPYFLYVGDLAGRKNVPFLIRAFDRADPAADLLLVGHADDDYAEIQPRSSARRGASASSRTPPTVTSTRSTAPLALVMPSRYEGFGFTPLEKRWRATALCWPATSAFRGGLRERRSPRSARRAGGRSPCDSSPATRRCGPTSVNEAGRPSPATRGARRPGRCASCSWPPAGGSNERHPLLLVNAHGADEFSGGAERYVAQLADGMGERGFDVEILSAFPRTTAAGP